MSRRHAGGLESIHPRCDADGLRLFLTNPEGAIAGTGIAARGRNIRLLVPTLPNVSQRWMEEEDRRNSRKTVDVVFSIIIIIFDVACPLRRIALVPAVGTVELGR